MTSQKRIFSLNFLFLLTAFLLSIFCIKDPAEAESRTDCLFNIETPILFAHRGGAGEVPESTKEAFRHAAITVGVDVLEIDIQVSKDGEIVVWHGPELENVFDNEKNVFFGKRDIRETNYAKDLKENARVIFPREKRTIDAHDRVPERKMMTLQEFINLVIQMEKQLKEEGKPRTLHLNIELKGGKKFLWLFGNPAAPWEGKDKNGKAVWDKLFGIIDPEAGNRTIIIASNTYKVIKAFRDENGKNTHPIKYKTNLSTEEQISYRTYMRDNMIVKLAKALGPIAGFFKITPRQKDSLKDYAFQTSHAFASKELSQAVRDKGGHLYTFLTTLGVPGFGAIDDIEDEKRLKELIEEQIEYGVDGLMTDYPEKVAKILEKLKKPEDASKTNHECLKQ